MHRVGYLAIFFLVVLAGLIQANGGDYISVLGIKPDILFVIVVFFSLFGSCGEHIKAALTAGILEDINCSSILGGYTLSFFLVAVLLNHNQRNFFKERLSMQILLVSAAYIAVNLLVFLLNIISKSVTVSYYPFLEPTLKGAIYTGIISPPIFFMLSKALRIHIAASNI